MLLLYLGFLFTGNALSQQHSTGKCPRITTKSSFNIDEYLGKWFEISQNKFSPENCVTYTLKSTNDGHIKGLVRGFDSTTGQESNKVWYAEVKKSEAKLTFLNASFPIGNKPSYWILDTDYSSFAVLWTCKQESSVNTKTAWIVARDPHPSVNVLTKAHQVLAQYGVTKNSLYGIDQMNCPNCATND